MKRLGSSDSQGPLISMCPASEDESGSKAMYSREYQSMLESLDEEEESGHNIPGKKRRLSVDQVKALEKNFEVENKLEPERKAKLARDLGLQPRQVAVWFQNRRARWKTKELERDYALLKANFDSLHHNFDSLQHHNHSLLRQIKELKSKLNEENAESNMCAKEDNAEGVEPIASPPSDDPKLSNTYACTNMGAVDFKDGPSESDSSAILNDDNNSPNASNSSGGGGFLQNSASLGFSCLSFTDSKSEGLASSNNNNVYHPQFVKLEEHNFFSGEEACNFFSDEAAPTLHWYCPDQWT